ncbi:hypothetical protein OG890_38885 [Streptomyces anulatus]|uniref:hypothetical protein n=1 Tax=Streptomyces anulatus TaxID=1892 RepID=UPI0022513E45|nr:hypothetical protein [Streptomyces anulatus]MCX4489812.1 hypothetical protein [Streptomyces anulatus]MCX4489855.1 hypothetical protein [Streptomyces anulatus]
MGRKKPGKPRRPRSSIPRQYTLQELQPPGDAYEEWYKVKPGMEPMVNDTGLGSEAADVMNRLARLGPWYDHTVPKAALLLDTVIDTGQLPVIQGGDADEATMIPVNEVAAARTGMNAAAVRESLHNLHAHGAFLVVPDKEHGVPLIRFVAKRPEHPGEAWSFLGDPGMAVASVCMPTEIWDELPLDVAGAVAFLRSYDAQLEEADPVVYGTHIGVNGTEHARELFAAARASRFVDYKGCEACPAGHLCTRTDENNE